MSALFCVHMFACEILKTHILAKQQADCVILVKLKLIVFPTFGICIFSRHNLIGVLYVKEIHSWPDTYNNASSLCAMNE